MSPKLTNVSSKKAHRAFVRLGFEDGHCTGSHQFMSRPRPGGGFDTLTLVLGKREIDPFTLAGTLRQAGVSLEEFTAQL